MYPVLDLEYSITKIVCISNSLHDWGRLCLNMIKA